MLAVLTIIMQCGLMKRLTMREEKDVFVSVPRWVGEEKKQYFALFLPLSNPKAVPMCSYGM